MIEKYNTLSPAVQNTILVFLGLTAAIGPLLLVAGTLITSITAIGIATGITMTAFLAVLPVIALVVAALAGLTYAYFNIKEKYGSIGAFFKQTWDGVKIMFNEAIDSLVGYFQPLINKINEVINKVSSLKNAITGAVSGAIGSVGSFLGFRASGGAVNPNRSFIVGENGPELFTPSTYGSITANNRLGGGGGINIVIYGDVMGQEIVNKVKNGIMNELKMNIQL